MHPAPARHSVSRTIGFGFGFLLLLLAALAAAAYAYLRIARESSVRLANEGVRRAAIAADLERALLGVRHELTVFSQTGKKEALAEGARRLGEFQRHLDRAEELSRSDPRQERFAAAVARLRAGLPAYQQQADDLRRLHGAIATSRLVAGMFYGVTATDPLTYAAVAGMFLLAGALAAWLPARRAAKVDPIVALRCE